MSKLHLSVKIEILTQPATFMLQLRLATVWRDIFHLPHRNDTPSLELQPITITLLFLYIVLLIHDLHADVDIDFARLCLILPFSCFSAAVLV